MSGPPRSTPRAGARAPPPRPGHGPPGRPPGARARAPPPAGGVGPGAPDIATSRWWKEERHGVFLDYNQNAKDRTVASAYSVRPTPEARVSAQKTARGPLSKACGQTPWWFGVDVGQGRSASHTVGSTALN